MAHRSALAEHQSMTSVSPSPSRSSSRGSVLVVCTGNVCRSPFAEGILRRALGDAVAVSSAGTQALAGWPMDRRAAARLRAHGGDPDGFVARQLTPAMAATADLVLTATRSHRSDVVALSPSALRRTFALGDFADLVAGMPASAAALTAPPSGVGEASSALPSVSDVVRAATQRRALVPPRPAHLVDIVDPFGGEDAIFDAMAQQLIAVLGAIAPALRGAADRSL